MSRKKNRQNKSGCKTKNAKTKSERLPAEEGESTTKAGEGHASPCLIGPLTTPCVKPREERSHVGARKCSPHDSL